MKPSAHFNKDISENNMCSSTKKLHAFIFFKKIRIFARQEAINAGQGQYALTVTGPIMKFFEKYYNVPYPLPKSGKSLWAMFLKKKII